MTLTLLGEEDQRSIETCRIKREMQGILWNGWGRATMKEPRGALRRMSNVVSSGIWGRETETVEPPSRKSSVTSDTSQSSVQTTISGATTPEDREEQRAIDPVVLHGEVISITTHVGLFQNKKHEYLVLTNGELFKFKSQMKALLVFPSSETDEKCRIAPANDSDEKLSKMHTIHGMFRKYQFEADHQSLLLRQIIAIREVGPTSFSIYYDDAFVSSSLSNISIVNLHYKSNDIMRCWIIHIRMAVQLQRVSGAFLSSKQYDYVKNYMRSCHENIDKTSEYHFKAFRVIQKLPKSSSRPDSGQDDITKRVFVPRILVIGTYSMHILPIPSAEYVLFSGNQLRSVEVSTYGLLSLSAMIVSPNDDYMRLWFQIPCNSTNCLDFASCKSDEIMGIIKKTIDHLRPHWPNTPLSMDLASDFETISLSEKPENAEMDMESFQHTLRGYAISYGVDVSNIYYQIYQKDSKTIFRLLPPTHFVSKKDTAKDYSFLELLSVFRTLRYQLFDEISFSNVNLTPLKGKKYRHDDAGYHERAILNLKAGLEKGSVLQEELRDLAIFNKSLTKLDLSGTIPKNYTSNGTDEKGSEVVAALISLNRHELITQVRSLNFSRIELDSVDIDWILDATANKFSRLEGLELSKCGLSSRSLSILLQSLEVQHNTMIVLDLSYNPGMIEINALNNTLSKLTYLKILRLGHCTFDLPDTFIQSQSLYSLRLHELCLDGILLSETIILLISEYLSDYASFSLRTLSLKSCGITGSNFAKILSAINLIDQPRDERLQIFAGDNRLFEGHDEIVSSILIGRGPARISIASLDYSSEEQFRSLLRAVTFSKHISHLDISRIGLPYEASKETCRCLAELFEKNTSLRELDLTGETGLLQTTGLGSGIAQSLKSLEKNRSLEVLKIEGNSIKEKGAEIIANVLLVNTTLRKIEFDKNMINFKGFCAIVSAMAKNTNIVKLSPLIHDYEYYLFHVSIDSNTTLASKASLAAIKKRHSICSKDLSLIRESLRGTSKILKEQWNREAAKLESYLTRNRSKLNA
ncbi:uncharacterized protein T551_02290 [Pneumocystis jirovecii RU7]|uniref:LRR-containing protein second PH domain-containing protein n=1 Tax=Pneumocystis jirovecii (strain RU7) TaxID=1408657 RepID=A0A0W4ZKX8_PNEJ7|nr:uncharacterized protein T551_02290 [Pneumocystis jirovecii RU7]KTW29016.1 hypothetical protein T551_02290 [Pneumocystis jirovecii RU7]